ncbi:hypothetical protein [Stenotrophomonas maltophilia]|uniref:hypothetical protein n=1 Tax=Stenotrophomonas maltophilia TaxID=40324 RepID=UPI0012DAF8BB|nr:hypothetical protein [Stenotrophomonas maltophilia]
MKISRILIYGMLVIGVVATISWLACRPSDVTGSKGDEVPLSEKSTSSTDIASESSIHQSLRSPHQSIESTVALGGKAFLLKIETPHYEGDASEYIDRRIAAARAGDAQSSYEIHNRIASCKRALNSGDADEYKAYASVEIGQEIGHCQGLIGRTELGDENWLSLAAAQGSVEARLIFAKDPKAIIGNLTEALKDPERITNYRRDAIDYLNESVSQGSVDSIEALADIHDRGIIADKSPEKSLAYWPAYQRAHPNIQSAASIARLSKLLQPNQIERSNEMSEAIYRSCCL